MHQRWREALLKGGEFPRLPIDYGYRDSLNFWFARGVQRITPELLHELRDKRAAEHHTSALSKVLRWPWRRAR